MMTASPFTYVQQSHWEEYLVLKDLLRPASGEHFFWIDDAARLRDISPLPDREILARLQHHFGKALDESLFELPLISVIDYLFP